MRALLCSASAFATQHKPQRKFVGRRLIARRPREMWRWQGNSGRLSPANLSSQQWLFAMAIQRCWNSACERARNNCEIEEVLPGFAAHVLLDVISNNELAHQTKRRTVNGGISAEKFRVCNTGKER